MLADRPHTAPAIVMMPRARCPVCGGVDRQPLLHVATKYVPASVGVVYGHCARCGLVHTERVIEDHDGLDTVYVSPYQQMDRTTWRKDTAYRRERNRYRQRWFEQQLAAVGREPSGRRLLEIGARDGSFLWLMQQRGWQTMGIDPNARYAHWAREQYGVQMVSDYFPAGLADGSTFDIIAFFQFFEHINDPPAFLAAVRTVLRPGGLIYLETPDLGFLHQRHMIKTHVILYSRRSLIQTLEQHGFRVVAITEYAPGLLTFDQLAVIAEVDPSPSEREWSCAEDVATAQALINRALSDDFPYGVPTARTRLFQWTQRLLGDRVAARLKRGYQAIAAIRAGFQLQRVGVPEGSQTAREFPGLIREAFLSGFLTVEHLQQLARLRDEFLQLHALARIRVYRLSVSATQELVDRLLAQGSS